MSATPSSASRSTTWPGSSTSGVCTGPECCWGHHRRWWLWCVWTSRRRPRRAGARPGATRRRPGSPEAPGPAPAPAGAAAGRSTRRCSRRRTACSPAPRPGRSPCRVPGAGRDTGGVCRSSVVCQMRSRVPCTATSAPSRVSTGDSVPPRASTQCRACCQPVVGSSMRRPAGCSAAQSTGTLWQCSAASEVNRVSRSGRRRRRLGVTRVPPVPATVSVIEWLTTGCAETSRKTR